MAPTDSYCTGTTGRVALRSDSNEWWMVFFKKIANIENRTSEVLLRELQTQ